ncbi:unnamed protein product [Brassica rapa subsp. trilocularis]
MVESIGLINELRRKRIYRKFERKRPVASVSATRGVDIGIMLASAANHQVGLMDIDICGPSNARP